MIDKNILQEYNKYRNTTATHYLCHAPFSNINFAQNGNMTACCFNRSHVLGKYPNQTIKEAWHGASAEDLRNQIRNNDLGGGCRLCALAIEHKNYSGSKAIYYDPYAKLNLLNSPKYFFEKLFGVSDKKLSPPSVFEFELSNTCNLGCIMCDGYFSSTIRQQREKLPPIKSPYDLDFVEQIASFLPDITDLKFLGGEPFLIDIYLEIWEKVLTVKPDIKIHITTNGSVLNERIKALLTRLNCGIVVSIDSINENTYAAIRKGGFLPRVLENIKYFYELTRSKGTYLSFAVCPMRENWKEIPSIIDFSNSMDSTIHFNVVWNPQPVALRFAPAKLLEEIDAYYSAFSPPQQTKHQKINFDNFRSLINQIKQWKAEKQMHEKADYTPVKTLLTSLYEKKTNENEMMIKLAALQLEQFLDPDNSYESTKRSFLALAQEISAQDFLLLYVDAAFYCLEKIGWLNENSLNRRNFIKDICLDTNDKITFISDLINNGVLSQFGYFINEDLEIMHLTITSRYS